MFSYALIFYFSSSFAFFFLSPTLLSSSLEGGLLKSLELPGHFTPMRPTSFRSIFPRITLWKLPRFLFCPFLAQFNIYSASASVVHGYYYSIVNGSTGHILASGSAASPYLQQRPYLFRYVCVFHS